ncbi:MAG TPA: 23S rRNA (guanosine(2251)-2'-O)-methyltransferase RlmB [Balneolaceae bacterium]|nr:23S rRNA (guanosine(2251)-2'-O)-methyltransferase RlmB [Balneolaceae bacterium]|tara:strand:- start:122843 stop:123586 length:744 start_codon:yes stop_codon:yes gene_type:complete
MRQNDNFLIFGRKPVEEILSNKAKEIDKIFVKNSIAPNSYNNISETAFKNQIPLVTVPDKKLERLVGKVNHQGFVAQLSKIKYLDFFEWIETNALTSDTAVLFLDGIEDPHNLGAILRTAAAAGISAVMVPTQNQSPINATVFKISAGTAGRIPVIRVHDTNQGLKDLNLAGFSLVALDAGAEHSVWDTDLKGPVAFIIGNEGRGVSKQVIKKCDTLIKLPMEHSVESLNASVTAALISYEWKRRLT